MHLHRPYRRRRYTSPITVLQVPRRGWPRARGGRGQIRDYAITMNLRYGPAAVLDPKALR